MFDIQSQGCDNIVAYFASDIGYANNLFNITNEFIENFWFFSWKSIEKKTYFAKFFVELLAKLTTSTMSLSVGTFLHKGAVYDYVISIKYAELPKTVGCLQLNLSFVCRRSAQTVL